MKLINDFNWVSDGQIPRNSQEVLSGKAQWKKTPMAVNARSLCSKG